MNDLRTASRLVERRVVHCVCQFPHHLAPLTIWRQRRSILVV